MANHINVVKANVYLPNDVIMTLKTTFNDVFKISRTVFFVLQIFFLTQDNKKWKDFLAPPPSATYS